MNRRREEQPLDWDIYDICTKAFLIAKRQIRKKHHISQSRKSKHSIIENYHVHNFDKKTVAYLIWAKLTSGIIEMQYIDSKEEKYLTKHINSSLIDVQAVYDELRTISCCYMEYNNKLKDVFYEQVFYRIVLLRLIKLYHLYLIDIEKSYEEIKDFLLNDFYKEYVKVIQDGTQYLLNLEEGLGELWILEEKIQ